MTKLGRGVIQMSSLSAAEQAVVKQLTEAQKAKYFTERNKKRDPTHDAALATAQKVGSASQSEAGCW